MKIIDRNGRLFGKISVIDVLVIAVVLVMAAALYVKNHQAHTGSAVTEQPITFVVRARGIDSYTADAIKTEDYLYDQTYSSGGRALGKITDVQVERDPGTKLADRLTDGTAALLEAEDTVDLLITVEGWGLITGKSYSINRIYDLGVNSSRGYQTSRASFTGTVKEIFPSQGTPSAEG